MVEKGIEKAGAVADGSSNLDKVWFQKKMKEHHLTTRKLADLMGLHYSAISRMFNGRQGIRANEAAELARHFMVPVEEVMRRAGIEVSRLAAPGRVPVVGWIDGAGLSHGPEGLEGPQLVDGPPHATPRTQAFRGQGGMSHGWLFFVDEATDVPAEAVGRLCIVQLRGEAGYRLRWVSRGYEPGELNLGAFDGSVRESGRLLSAAPIVWMRQ